MQTYTGVAFYPFKPRAEDIRIEDIAHSLSLQCRFGGHCQHFYSVAQHSVLVANLLPNHLALTGLLHDATEAYLVDLPRPVKQGIPQYREVEERLASVIAARFYRFGRSIMFDHPAIKEADNRVLMTEARDLMGMPPKPWTEKGVPLDHRIHPLSPDNAKSAFLAKFLAITQ